MASLESLGISPIKNGRYMTTCPKCSADRKPAHRNTPCLTVNNEVGNVWWNCNHCGWKGNLGMYEKFDKVYQASRMPKVKPSIYHKQVTDWLSSKHITPETALKCGVYEVDGMNGHKEVAFPYYYQRTLVNVMFRRIVYDKEKGMGKVYQLSKDKHGTKTCFWGLEMLDLNQSREVVIVEGQTDRMTHIQCGKINVLSVPMGAPSPNSTNLDAKLEFVTDPYIIKLFEGVEKFYLFTDGDEPGVYLRDLLADKLGKTRCYIYNYPKDYKDSNEIFGGDIEKNLDPLGKAGIERMYELARPYPIKGIITVQSAREELEKLANSGFTKGWLTGKHEFDRLFTLKPKILAGLTGVPSFGKSVVWRQYMHDMCKNNPDMRLGGFTPEMRPASREYAKIAELFIGKSWDRNKMNSMSEAEREFALKFVERHFTIINPDTNNFETMAKKMGETAVAPKGLRNVLAYMKYLKQTIGIKGFWIDAWNKLDHQRPSNKPIEEFISQELDFLLEFLNKEDLFCMVIAHPTKMETIRGGNYRKPTLYDIKGSSAWNEKLDIGMVAHRMPWIKTNQKDENGDEVWEMDNTVPTILSVEKMKFDELGCIGSQKLWLDKSKGDRFVFDNIHANDYEAKKSRKKVQITSSAPVRDITEPLSESQSDDDEFIEPPF